MKTLLVPPGISEMTIDGEVYNPDDNGEIIVANSHVATALMHGCKDPNGPETPAILRVLPEVDAEALSRALIEENEAIKAEADRLREDNSALTLANDGLRNDLQSTNGWLEASATAIEKLSAALTAAGGDPAAVLAAPGGTESGEGQHQEPGAASGAGGTVDLRSPAAKKAK